MSVLHNIHVLEGGEVVGIQGTKLYSPYKKIGVKSLVKAMSVTKKTVDSMNGIPSAIDFVIEYGDRMKETDRESAENEWIETFRNRPPFLFVHPLLFTFFGGDTKVNTKDTFTRIIELLTHPKHGVGPLAQATELLQFIWAAENGFMKPVSLTEVPESDELETIQSISTANFQRAELDKINGQKHGELDIGPEEEKEKEE